MSDTTTYQPKAELSVIVVTINRPDCVQRCMESLRTEGSATKEIILVDASADDRTQKIAEMYPEVRYFRTAVGFGHMTASRNFGLKKANGEIISFLDDDAFPHPGWSEAILASFANPEIGGVGGRALNSVRDEATIGLGEIGLLKPNGFLTGNFAADPGQTIDTDHIIGCNMAWRASILREMGGLREDYPGTEVREETDISIRVRKLGYRIVFNPAAIVDHIGAPQVKGRRFDVRYAYYAQRNHLTLLIRNFGLGSRKLWAYAGLSFAQMVKEFFVRFAAASARVAAITCGSVVGVLSGLRLLITTGTDPRRGAPATVQEDGLGHVTEGGLLNPSK